MRDTLRLAGTVGTAPPRSVAKKPPDRERSGQRRTSLFWRSVWVLVVALSYFAGTRIGFALTPTHDPIATFWPPNALLLSALLLTPVRLWWALLIAVIPAHFVAQLANGVPVATAGGWLVGNAGEALFGATLIRKSGGRRALFESVGGTARFLLLGFLLAPLLTSFLDAAVVIGTSWGRDYWVLWTTRLLSNTLAQLTIVPTIVAVGQRDLSRLTETPRHVWLEAALLATAVVGVSLFVFRGDTFARTSIPAIIYLPLPLLLWASLRFGAAGLSASLLTIAFLSIHSLMHGRGPFISPSVATSVLSMQIFLCMIGVPLLLLAAVTTEQRQTEQSLRVTSRKLIDAQERERQRIAQELHDNIGQTLTLAEIQLDGMIARQSDRPSGSDLNRLRDQMTMISQTICEISHGLYPSNLEYLGLARALTRLCADVQEETRLDLHYEVQRIPARLPADLSLCLYRVAQEALQNIVRHSGARHASVRLRADGRRLSLQIVDDGIGFTRSGVAPGLGFASMRERLMAVNGDIAIDSAPGSGTRVDAWVPLDGVPSARDAALMLQHDDV